MTTTVEPATMNLEAAAKYIGVGRQTAYDLAAQGKFPGALKLGRRWVVSVKRMNAWLEGGVEAEHGHHAPTA